MTWDDIMRRRLMRFCDGTIFRNNRKAGRHRSSTLSDLSSPTYVDASNGSFKYHDQELDDVVNFHINASQLMRQGKLRNGDVRLRAMSLSAGDVDAPVAFLKALTEDYDDA
jgi:hypothetical protein